MPEAKKKTKTPPQQTYSFEAETSKVLRLMIHSLYTNKDIFLRELISNASDACDKLRYNALTEPALLGDDGELRISIRVSAKDKTVTVSDNGIGMNREDLIANLGTIARSGTQDFLEQLADQKEKDVSLIGQFGVGFYSSYMVADKVDVVSRKAGEAEAWKWSSDGNGEFTVTQESDAARGTSITLHLRDDAAEYLDRFRLQHIIKTYSDHIGFPISLSDDEAKPFVVNEASALWVRPKNSISQEQYQEFYHHVAHSPDTPWLSMHNVVEGKVSYINLLFIPSLKPFDLFHPERRRRVKLYVKRVFITDENVDVIPHYLRFLRGIIDSEDLPLNISRETLQKNPQLLQIKDSITTKVLGELKKKAEKDPEGYAAFWQNFGAVLKEGLCEPVTPREKILDVCRFHSTSGEALVSLDDYISRMKEGQEDIYYLTGDSLETLKKSPLLEGFTSRQVEVLLLTDHVDDFWVNAVPDVKGKPLKSITRSNIDLGNLPDTQDNKEKTSIDAKPEDVSGLLAYLKTLYGDEIKDVRTTTKLIETPACLAVDEHEMDFRMERFLMEHNQLPKRSAKIFEINARHPLVLKLSSMVSQPTVKDSLEDAAWLLLDQAKIAEGEAVSDPASFARRLSRFMQLGID